MPAAPRWPLLALLLALLAAVPGPCRAMPPAQRRQLRDTVVEMFYHSYDSYLANAFPKDELRPLTCTGIDNYGGYSLTMVDALDMLVLLGNLTEFERAVNWLGDNLQIRNDATISVFEVNIRVLGGLLSAHHQARLHLPNYSGRLLELSVELADALLPAFDSPTGIPYNEINARNGADATQGHTTCPAAAGTLLLEFGYLTAITGNCKYLGAARKALDSLWHLRSRVGLFGTILDLHTGQWRVAEADIGASTDSLYEYLLKSHIFFNDPHYQQLFAEAYASAERHMRQDDWYVSVNSHTGQNPRRVVNSLQAFWPGMQVLHGDVAAAQRAHERFHCLAAKYRGFLPERFSLDQETTQAAGYPLRPEFVESTYFLFQATGSHRYLDIGATVVDALQSRARVGCGFAAVLDIVTGRLEDKMDSYFLSETLKYLYLLFSEDDPLGLRTRYVFTTEAHFLPVSLDVFVAHRNCTRSQLGATCSQWNHERDHLDRHGSEQGMPKAWRLRRQRRLPHRSDRHLHHQCVRYTRLDHGLLRRNEQLHAAYQAQQRPKPAAADGGPPPLVCRAPHTAEPFLGHPDAPDTATCFRRGGAGPEPGAPAQHAPKPHFSIRGRGNEVIHFTINDPAVKVQPTDAGVELRGITAEQLQLPQLQFSVFAHSLAGGDATPPVEMGCSPASFGTPLPLASVQRAILYYPSRQPLGCEPFTTIPPELEPILQGGATKVVLLIDRGDCPFQRKVEHAQAVGAAGVIVANTQNALLQMSADIASTNASLVTIPAALVSQPDGDWLKQHMGTVGVTFAAASDLGLSRLGLKVEPLPGGNGVRVVRLPELMHLRPAVPQRSPSPAAAVPAEAEAAEQPREP